MLQQRGRVLSAAFLVADCGRCLPQVQVVRPRFAAGAPSGPAASPAARGQRPGNAGALPPAWARPGNHTGGARRVPGLWLKVVWPPGVGDRGLGGEAEPCLLGAGGQCLGDLVPGAAVEPGIGDELGEEAFGLAGEAGDEGDGGQVVAGPGAAALSERGEGVVGQVVGVVAAARAGSGVVMVVSCWWSRLGSRGAVRTGMSHWAGTLLSRQAGPGPAGGRGWCWRRAGRSFSGRSLIRGVSRLSGQARRQDRGVQGRGRRWQASRAT